MKSSCVINTPQNINDTIKKERDKQTSIVTSYIFDAIYLSNSLSTYIPISNPILIKKFPLVFTPSKRLKFNRGLLYLPFDVKIGNTFQGASTFKLRDRTLSNANLYNDIKDYETIVRVKNKIKFKILDLYKARPIYKQTIKSKYQQHIYNTLAKYQAPCRISLYSLYDYILTLYNKSFLNKDNKTYSLICHIEQALFHILTNGSIDKSTMIVSYYPSYKVSNVGGRIFEKLGMQGLPKQAKQNIIATDYDIKKCGISAIKILLSKHNISSPPDLSFSSYSQLYGFYKYEPLLLNILYKEWSYPIINKMGIPLYVRKKNIYSNRRKILAHIIFGMEVHALYKAITTKKINYVLLEHDGFRAESNIKDFYQDKFLFRKKED